MSTPAPVFLLAAPFCGVSHLAAQLGCHPQLVALPELNLFMGDRIGEILEIAELSQSAQMDGLLRAIAQIEFDEQTDDTIAAARQWLEQRRDLATGALIHHLAGRVAPLRLVIPDTGSSMRPMDLRRLARQIPDAKFLHIVRHPWTQGCLLAAWARDRLFVPPDYKDFSFDPPEVDPQIPWLRANCNVDALMRELPESRARRVQIEMVESSFDDAAVTLCTWLEVASGQAELDAMKSSEAWEFSGFGPGTAPYGLEAEVLEILPDEDVERSSQVTLHGALPWRIDGMSFSPETLGLALGYGYA
ncbi:MAG: sulfotransferase [Panacagrimonas sp.]